MIPSGIALLLFIASLLILEIHNISIAGLFSPNSPIPALIFVRFANALDLIRLLELNSSGVWGISLEYPPGAILLLQERAGKRLGFIRNHIEK